MHLLIATFLIIFFSGCVNNIMPSIVVKNQAMTKTKKEEVQIDGKRFLLVGTYLNDIEHEALHDDENEHFIVSLYEGGENPFQEPINKAYLNENLASWEKLDSNDPLLEMIPLYNAWGTYYHIWANEVYPDTLNLKIEIDPLRQIDLVFQKDPR